MAARCTAHALRAGACAGAVAVSCAALGCLSANDCELGESHCEGNLRYYCDEASSEWVRYVWHTQDCSQICVDASQGASRAHCTESDVPDARCTNRFESTFCSGNAILSCSDGFLLGHSDCGSATCVSVSGGVTCADPTSPCFDAPSFTPWICEGDIAIHCASPVELGTVHCPQCKLDQQGQPVDGTMMTACD